MAARRTRGRRISTIAVSTGPGQVWEMETKGSFDTRILTVVKKGISVLPTLTASITTGITSTASAIKAYTRLRHRRR
jgi:hypothetical protein